MKKIFILLLTLILLTACGVKREDFYVFTYGDKNIAVGYDETCDDFINHKKTYIEKDEKEVITYAEFYIKDLEDKGIYSYSIDEVNLDSSVKSNCNKLNGRLIENNGYTCVVSKDVDSKLIVVELHGNIVNDDMDKLDRVVIQVK